MINPIELRLDNWVKIKSIFIDEFIEGQISFSDFENLKENPSNYRPIILTEKWLSPDAAFLNLGIDENGTYFYNYGDGRWVDIEYVHTYQNLYFALTGQELTLSIP